MSFHLKELLTAKHIPGVLVCELLDLQSSFQLLDMQTVFTNAVTEVSGVCMVFSPCKYKPFLGDVWKICHITRKTVKTETFSESENSNIPSLQVATMACFKGKSKKN